MTAPFVAPTPSPADMTAVQSSAAPPLPTALAPPSVSTAPPPSTSTAPVPLPAVPPRVAADAIAASSTSAPMRPVVPATSGVMTNPALGPLLADPFGTVIGGIAQIGKDLGTVMFSTTSAELANPEFRLNLQSRGINPDALRNVVSVNEYDAAAVRSLGMGAATLATMGTAPVVSSLVGRVLVNRAAQTAVAGAVDGFVGGATYGAVAPPAGMGRGQAALDYGLVGMPLAAFGGLLAQGLRARMAVNGLKPDLEAPELTRTQPTSPILPTALTSGDIINRIVAPLAEAQQRVDPIAAAANPVNTTPHPSLPPTAPMPVTTVDPIVELDPTQRVLRGVSVGEQAPQAPLSDRLHDFFTRQYGQWLDDLAPINDATKALLRQGGAADLRPGFRLPGADDPTVLADIAKRTAAQAHDWIINGPTSFDARLQRTGTPGLAQSFRQAIALPDRTTATGAITGMDDLRAYVTANQVVERAAQGVPDGPVAPVDAQATVDFLRAQRPEVVGLAKQVTDFNNDVAAYVARGLDMSPGAGAALQRFNNYVPLYRFLDEAATQGPSGGGRGQYVGTSSPIKAVVGGAEDLRLLDPLEGSVKNAFMLTQYANDRAVGQALYRLSNTAPEQNILTPVAPEMYPTQVAGEEVAKQLEAAGLPEAAASVRALDPASQDDLMTLFRPSTFLDDKTVALKVDGQTKLFTVDPALKQALSGTQAQAPELANMAVKILGGFTDVLRSGVVHDPAFMLNVAWKHAMSGPLSSSSGMLPLEPLVRGIFRALSGDDLYDKAMAAGMGMGNYGSTSDRPNLQLEVARAAGTQSMVRQAWDAMAAAGQHALQSTPVTEFGRLLSQGSDPLQAAYLANDIQNFARFGQSMRMVNRVVPFANAVVQPSEKVIRKIGEAPFTTAAKALAYYGIPSLANYLINRNHDAQYESDLAPEARSYAQLPAYRRDLFFNIPYRMHDETHYISLPRGFNVAAIVGSLVDRVARSIDYHAPGAMDGFASEVASNDLPGVMPAALSALGILKTGVDPLTGQGIVPPSEEKLLPQYQRTMTEGDATQALARVFRVSPRVVATTVRTLTGGIGDNLLKSADDVARWVNGQSLPAGVSPALGVPFFGPMVQRFSTPEPGMNGASVERFYDAKTMLDQLQHSVSAKALTVPTADKIALIQHYGAEFGPWIRQFDLTEKMLAKTRLQIEAVRQNGDLTTDQQEAEIMAAGRHARAWTADLMQRYGQFQADSGARDLDRLAGMQTPGTAYRARP